MRWKVVMLAALTMVLVAAPASAQVFVTGPAQVGNPADDPGIALCCLDLDEALGAPIAGEKPLRPWDEEWYQLSQMPGV